VVPFSARWSDTEPTGAAHELELSCEQTIRSRGVCEPALEPRGGWEGSRTRGQDFKPDLGNSAVRHYRGAFENVAMVEMRTQLVIERAGLVTLHLQLARRSSIPTIDRASWVEPSRQIPRSAKMPCGGGLSGALEANFEISPLHRLSTYGSPSQYCGRLCVKRGPYDFHIQQDLSRQ
jgi:hypothetical protein